MTVRVGGAGGIPAGALGAMLNVVATEESRSGYLSVLPHGVAAGISSVNFRVGVTTANQSSGVGRPWCASAATARPPVVTSTMAAAVSMMAVCPGRWMVPSRTGKCA